MKFDFDMEAVLKNKDDDDDDDDDDEIIKTKYLESALENAVSQFVRSDVGTALVRCTNAYKLCYSNGKTITYQYETNIAELFYSKFSIKL